MELCCGNQIFTCSEWGERDGKHKLKGIGLQLFNDNVLDPIAIDDVRDRIDDI